MAHVNVSSWVRGNRLEEMEATTVGDILQRQSISTNESNVEVVDAAGNKSGTTSRTNGITTVDVGLPTLVTMIHKVPTEPKGRAGKATGGQAKYPLRVMKKKASFDVPFTPHSNKQTKKVVTRVDAAIRHFRKSHPRTIFTTRLLVTGSKGTKTSNGHTHIIRVWRLK